MLQVMSNKQNKNMAIVLMGLVGVLVLYWYVFKR